jgi:hypothetical protein
VRGYLRIGAGTRKGFFPERPDFLQPGTTRVYFQVFSLSKNFAHGRFFPKLAALLGRLTPRK